MRRLVYLAAAQRDLVSILEYITRESGSVAIGVAFTDRLQAQCARLAALPGHTRPSPSRAPARHPQLGAMAELG